MNAVICMPPPERPIWDRASGRVFGKVALVTGAASGIGRETVLRLAANSLSTAA